MPTSRDDSGRPTWPSRNDVFVYYDSEWGLQSGALTAGFGAYGDALHFGLEVEVGRLIGDHYPDEPLLIIKVAYGGRSLASDFRPPSAGGQASPGAYYTRLVEDYRSALDSIDTAFPTLAGLTPSLEGFVWWQGFNDFCCGGYGGDFSSYTSLFGHLVADLSQELNWPASLPVVIGETGNVEGGDTSAFWAAQRAVTQLPALAGRVAFVPTQQYLYEGSQGPDSTHRHHWYGNALSYLQIGHAAGQALRGLLPPPSPP